MAQKYLYTENTVRIQTESLVVPGTVIVEADAFIIPAGGDGFDLDPGAWTFQVNGTIIVDSAGNDGIHFNESVASIAKNSLVTVGSEGTVFGTYSGIHARAPVNITNSGLIGGSLTGVIAQGFGPTTSKGFTITNNKSGEIVGDTAILNLNPDQILTVKNQGTIAGTVGIEWAGAGVVTNTGTIEGAVEAYSAALPSSITNGGTIHGGIYGLNGNETVKNSGLVVGDIDLSGGNNSLTNTGTIHGAVSLGTGDDIMTNSGTIDGAVNLSDGNNTLTNSGILSGGSFSFGAGNDVVKNTGTVAAVIHLGGGNNTFTGGSHSEQVQDQGSGKDIYKLGGGNDSLSVASFTDNVCDGGAGVDTFTAYTSPDNVSINLDSKAVILDGETLLAATASVRGSLTGSAIKGFETVIGGGGHDLIVGSKGADTLSGNGGNDYIAGGLGADTLSGGFGGDAFVLFQVKDSGTTVATRDTITDFEAGSIGGETIDVSAIDTNTKQTGDQGFVWIGYNAAFDHDTGFGELRAFIVNGDTIIEGDANGDGKTDFSIAVLGVTGIDGGDFTL
jgi:Ca2+-binding RTX toxin-like protein